MAIAATGVVEQGAGITMKKLCGPAPPISVSSPPRSSTYRD
jgi:hypothetical protein